MTPKQITDYVAGTMAIEGQGLTKKQYDSLLKFIINTIQCR